MRSLSRRIVDARVLRLMKLWLECAVEDAEDEGRKRRTTEAKDGGRAIPQGSPISPLLANLYMRRFVLGVRSRLRTPRRPTGIVQVSLHRLVLLFPEQEEADQIVND